MYILWVGDYPIAAGQTCNWWLRIWSIMHRISRIQIGSWWWQFICKSWEVYGCMVRFPWIKGQTRPNRLNLLKNLHCCPWRYRSKLDLWKLFVISTPRESFWRSPQKLWSKLTIDTSHRPWYFRRWLLPLRVKRTWLKISKMSMGKYPSYFGHLRSFYCSS